MKRCISFGNRAGYLRVIFLLVLASYSIFVALCLVETLDWQISWDTPPIHYTAWRLLEGDRLYQDIFDVSMPGSYLIHMLAISSCGRSDRGFRVFDLLWVSFTCFSMFLFFRKARWKGALAASIVFIAYYLAGGEPNMQEREIHMLPLLLVSFHFFRTGIDGKYVNLSFILSGFFLGFASFIKPFSLIILGFYLFF